MPNFTLIAFVFFVLKMGVAFFDFTAAEIVVDMTLALLLLQEFWRWRLPVFHSEAILWVLHLALFWLPLALLLGALGNLATLLGAEPNIALEIHLVAIGFITTILIGFGTRVTLGHSAQPPYADRLAKALFFAIEFLVLLRAAYSLQAMLSLDMQPLFDISATLWIAIFLTWAIRYGGVLYSGKKLNSIEGKR